MNDEHASLKVFVAEYLNLCNEYKCEVLINAHGVHCVQKDDGKLIPFATLYPKWNEEI